MIVFLVNLSSIKEGFTKKYNINEKTHARSIRSCKTSLQEKICKLSFFRNCSKSKDGLKLYQEVIIAKILIQNLADFCNMMKDALQV